jgi:hypothetical protein
MSGQVIVQVSRHGSFLGTRRLGTKVRAEILEACTDSEQLTIDFSGVDAISHSFADECVGGLLVGLGAEAFKARIRFKGMTEEMNTLLKLVTLRRIQAAKMVQPV